ncbi:MAG: hypothetical protein LPK25_01285 [Cyclobacteriaceae bacterium]|nr:hypothetical protein [Cyclobacteriaceae bacterium]MDX5465452.1 hypothetical protein [Cyclobacteriaceae bacterium]
MSKHFIRLVLSFSVILSIGFGNIFSAYSQIRGLHEQTKEEVDLQHQVQEIMTSTLDHEILKSTIFSPGGRGLTCETENLEEKNEAEEGRLKVAGPHSLLAELFKSLLLGDIDYYSTKILHFCKHYSPLSWPRIHLVIQVFLI